MTIKLIFPVLVLAVISTDVFAGDAALEAVATAELAQCQVQGQKLLAAPSCPNTDLATLKQCVDRKSELTRQNQLLCAQAVRDLETSEGVAAPQVETNAALIATMGQ
jgi:hypothetical protein